MIGPHALALGENIAVAMPEGKLVPEGAILGGLNAVSYSVADYTEDFRTQVPDVTANLTEHTMLMDEAASRLAELLRGSLDLIRDVGVPFGKALASGSALTFRKANLPWFSQQNVQISYANIDDPFFESSLYPTVEQMRNKSLTFTNVSLNALKRLRFAYLSQEDLVAFINSNHPEVVSIVNDDDTILSDVFDRMTNLDALKDLFVCNGEGFDFTQVRSVEINRLLKMFVLLGRMNLADKPLGLEDGSLQDYREFVELLYNGLIMYLSNLKKSIEAYRARGVVVRAEKQPRMVEHTDKDTGQMVYLLEARATIFYTQAVVDRAEATATSLSDAVLGALYGQASGRPVAVADLVGDKATIDDLVGRYLRSIETAMLGKAKEVFITSAISSATKFVAAKPELRGWFDKNLGTEGRITSSIIAEHLGSQFEGLYIKLNQRDGGSANDAPVSDIAEAESVLEVIFSTEIIPNFLRMLGASKAADILAYTYVTGSGEDNITNKRERLHVALIEVLADDLLKG